MQLEVFFFYATTLDGLQPAAAFVNYVHTIKITHYPLIAVCPRAAREPDIKFALAICSWLLWMVMLSLFEDKSY
jgi:hypothetical protein